MNPRKDNRLNRNEPWVILDSKGNIVERFRLKITARNFMNKTKRDLFGLKLTMKYVEEGNENHKK